MTPSTGLRALRRAAADTLLGRREQRMEVAAAIPAEGGRKLPVAALAGPRPLPLKLSPASLAQQPFFFGTFGPDFSRTEARLHTLESAYIVIGSGWDGAVLTADRKLIRETAAFTPFANMGEATYPFELPSLIQGETLKDVVVGFDGGWRNYYHWTVHGLGRTWLAARAAPGSTALFPDLHAQPNGGGHVDASVLAASLKHGLPGVRTRMLKPGVHPVENLSFVWTQPTAPTDLAEIADLQDLFASIRERVAGARPAATRRIYFSREGALDPRLPAADQVALRSLLDGFGFERLLLETMSFEQQVRAAAEAEILMGPHGAGMTNLVFSPRESVVVELQRPVNGEGFLRPWFYQLATARGQRYTAIDVTREGWVLDLQTTLQRLLP